VSHAASPRAETKVTDTIKDFFPQNILPFPHNKKDTRLFKSLIVSSGYLVLLMLPWPASNAVGHHPFLKRDMTKIMSGLPITIDLLSTSIFLWGIQCVNGKSTRIL
jgi:hypothetical protein